MGDEQAIAATMARLEQAERTLRETLSLLHDLAKRLEKLERAVGLMICAQLEDKVRVKADKSGRELIDDMLGEARTRRCGDPK